VLLADDVKLLSDAQLVIHGIDGGTRTAPVTLRIDTPIEVDHYKHGGILPFVLRQLLAVRVRRLRSVAIFGFATEPPLAHRHLRNDVVHRVRCRLCHVLGPSANVHGSIILTESEVGQCPH
jgi:hypothetical protein